MAKGSRSTSSINCCKETELSLPHTLSLHSFTLAQCRAQKLYRQILCTPLSAPPPLVYGTFGKPSHLSDSLWPSESSSIIVPTSTGFCGEFNKHVTSVVCLAHPLCSRNISSHLIQSFPELFSYLKILFPWKISGVFHYIHQCQPLAPGHLYVLLLFLTSVV